ncbi:nuclear transport factor 2 family protein [Noviherbaspirillum galbum]|uniref:Nuclear transport factor 2 family protein n=1 Tax=Noviherbaspirillum galbum TaxID=2709383 RepID=A0A6B3SG18_9BURK|nr:nuclear transport factor 2 family protein [Noviherbaspirillum galbum]NEX59543.1 nuclear transport factor 2 family protein [Noviherbaspirillum galbum]
MQTYTDILRTYMAALGRSDYATITGLFATDGRVRSPFLGEMPAVPFFERLGQASATNVIIPIDIFLSAQDKNHAVAYFQYDWTVRDGTLISFKVMDLFRFRPGTCEIEYLDLIYDTHPIRATAGDKYQASAQPQPSAPAP